MKIFIALLFIEGDSKVIMQREQPLSEYALTGVACSKSGLLGQPHSLCCKIFNNRMLNTYEGDPKVNGLPSLLFIFLFSDVYQVVKKR